MKQYLINSKQDLYNIGLKSQLGPIIIKGRLETVFDAREHVVNTIQKIDSKNVKMKKYTLTNLHGLDDFLEMNLSMQNPMFQRLSAKLFVIDPDF
jgi:hypothetical protein